jgi:hypothetical protein
MGGVDLKDKTLQPYKTERKRSIMRYTKLSQEAAKYFDT